MTRGSALSLFMLIPIVCIFLISIVFVGIGLSVAIEATRGVLTGGFHTELRPGLMLVEALDMFMVAFMFYIASIGFGKLLLPAPVASRILHGLTPAWFEAASLTDLKILIWEVLLTAVLIVFIGDVYRAEGNYSWNMLLVPAAILLISCSILFLKRAEAKE